MSDSATANYVFLPWVRQGAATLVQTPDTLGAGQPGVFVAPVRVQVNEELLERQLRVMGPGDVLGFATAQVIRTEPRAGTQDFEPNYFPAIEFDRPDLPWLLTPAKADANNRLRPWLCLIVLRKQEGVTVFPSPDQALPVLRIAAPAVPAHELPDLAESWAWAHAQVMGSSRQAVSLKDPALNLSRLLCPRRLDVDTDYLAVVVPTFELGRKAGLGLPITAADEERLAPAWELGAGAPDQVELPVYFQWEFRTGSGGDFESLVERLEPRSLPREVGRRSMDIGEAGLGVELPPGASTVLELEGPLLPVGSTPAPWPSETRAPFQAALESVVEAPWVAMSQEGVDPLVAPPLYGCWQAARHLLEPAAAGTAGGPWLEDLNLDPRLRAIASLGTRVVQDQQELLVAAAWERLGEIERVNQLRRQAQLARAVSATWHTRHFGKFPQEALLQVVSTAQSRLLVTQSAGSGTLLSQTIATSALPARGLSSALRKLSRPRGVTKKQARAPGAIVATLNTRTIVAAERDVAALATVDQVTSAAGNFARSPRFHRVSSGLDLGRRLAKYNAVAEGDSSKLLAALSSQSPDTPDTSDSADALAFRDAALAHHAYVAHELLGASWRAYKQVFSGGPGIVYGVDHADRLTCYRLGAPELGRGSWTLPIVGLLFEPRVSQLFYGGDGILYGTTASGQLLFYKHSPQSETRDISGPKSIGKSGWEKFPVVFSGGKGTIYAVNDKGEMFFFRDLTMNGTGLVSDGVRIRPVVWTGLKFIFPGAAGVIYAVDAQGKLLRYQLTAPDESGRVEGPVEIGSSGWLDFRSVFSDGAGTLYAVDNKGRLYSAQEQIRDGKIRVAAPTRSGVAPASAVDLPELSPSLLLGLDPKHTIVNRVSASLVLSGDAGARGDPLEPILEAPSFPQPMVQSLRDVAPELILPGLDKIPADTVALLESNPAFIASFLVGLNTELGRELLWRKFPMDQRSTLFTRFWDSEDPTQPDIDPIHTWGERPLRGVLRSGGQLVLLLRGELLRRYPGAVVYAVPAVPGSQGRAPSSRPEDERFPIFRGALEPDLVFLGFDLSREQIEAGLGWFFIIQEQLTEPRFGLDAASFVEPDPPGLSSWRALSWRHLAPTPEALAQLTHVSTQAALPALSGAKWGRNAAHMAYITLQRPVRIAIHASDMLPQQTG